MANFLLKIASGTTVVPWLDKATDDKPSRVNPHAEINQLRHVGRVGVPIVVHAIVPALGEDPPEDSALGGNLFNAQFHETPGAMVAITTQESPAATSIMTFTPNVPGHWVLVVSRPQGGGVIAHLDVLNA